MPAGFIILLVSPRSNIITNGWYHFFAFFTIAEGQSVNMQYLGAKSGSVSVSAISTLERSPYTHRVPICMPVVLQESGMDTVDANRALGFPDDCREYTSVHNILKELGVKSIRLMVSGRET